MLQFIYSDVFPDVVKLAISIPMCTPTILLQQLLAAADRYLLDRLKHFCELMLSELFDMDTVADNLALAERYRCPALKGACLEFIGQCLEGGYDPLALDNKNRALCFTGLRVTSRRFLLEVGLVVCQCIPEIFIYDLINIHRALNGHKL